MRGGGILFMITCSFNFTSISDKQKWLYEYRYITINKQRVYSRNHAGAENNDDILLSMDITGV